MAGLRKGNTMELRVTSMQLPTMGIPGRTVAITYLKDADYVTRPGCPICGIEETQALSQVRTSNQKGLEIHFCTDCEHIFFRRYPNEAWYSNYYEWDQDFSKSLHLSFARRLKRFVRNRPFVHDIWLKRLSARHRSSAAISAMLREAVTDANLLHMARLKIRNVLEIGCGLGGTLQLYKSFGLSPVGIDASPQRVAYCRADGLNVMEVPLSDISAVGALGPFDLITSLHVLEHIVDLNRHLTQILELSHDGTYLYFEVPNSLQENIFSRSFDPVHVHVFSLRSLTCLLAKYGFTVIRIFQDLNTHVLAVRSDSVSSNFEYREASIVKFFERGLAQLREIVGQPVRIRWLSAYHTVVTNLSTGEEIYRHKLGFPIREVTAAMQFSLEGVLQENSASAEGALVFLHSGDQAPIMHNVSKPQ
jgi:cyclopropane fatty-acyl-phospholipid synthase-like methyltransferase